MICFFLITDSWSVSSVLFRCLVLPFRSRAMSAITCDHGDSTPTPYPQLAFQRTYAIQSRGWSTGSGFRSWPPSASPRLRGEVLFFRSRAIPALTAIFVPHPRLFPTFCCKQNTFAIRRLGLPCVALGWPLGHAWATQGPPNPKSNPSRQWVVIEGLCLQIPGVCFG
jgi:hypothetical protein